MKSPKNQPLSARSSGRARLLAQMEGDVRLDSFTSPPPPADGRGRGRRTTCGVCEVCAKKKGNPKVRGKCLGTGDMQRVAVFTRPKRARDGGGEGGGGGGGASAAAPKGTKRQPGSMQVGDSVSFYELQSGTVLVWGEIVPGGDANWTEIAA